MSGIPQTCTGLALNLTEIRGGIFIATHLVFALWVNLGSLHYFFHYPKDKLAFKIMLFCDLEPDWNALITSWGNATSLDFNPKFVALPNEIINWDKTSFGGLLTRWIALSSTHSTHSTHSKVPIYPELWIAMDCFVLGIVSLTCETK
ncbi:hypothetical protein BT96DRAFT_973968 [Gymnopus androsaceus JB14]|uniref:Uncharacterized protein n=1 Tax=Gymnopus androsaceus JB14 TaxID=1447944 RepID=A0A6A4I0S6_9AGAR|nr:hypothetical protein BT96DRAFT_973968 [Gymnopus androsaceus JB14]